MIEVLDDELSLENGFKSSLSKLKKQSYNKKNRRSYLSKKPILMEDDDVDLGDLGSPKSTRSLEFPTASTSASSIHVSEPDSTVADEEELEVEFDAEGFAEKMKTAAILLAQLQQDPQQQSQQQETLRANDTASIRQKIIAEMMALEDDRMEKMAKEGVLKGMGDGGESVGKERKLDDEKRIAMVVNKEDPSAAVFSEDWEAKKERIRAASPYGHLPNWRLISVIVKNGADLRQEQFAIQLIREMQKIWQDTKVDVWVQ